MFADLNGIFVESGEKKMPKMIAVGEYEGILMFVEIRFDMIFDGHAVFISGNEAIDVNQLLMPLLVMFGELFVGHSCGLHDRVGFS